MLAILSTVLMALPLAVSVSTAKALTGAEHHLRGGKFTEVFYEMLSDILTILNVSQTSLLKKYEGKNILDNIFIHAFYIIFLSLILLQFFSSRLQTLFHPS
jgi:hypothetical protein